MLQRWLRWLLELHHPAPTWSEDERLAYQAQWLRWNYVVNVTEGAFWWFGMSFASATTILPLFVSKLTDSKLPLALIAALAAAGWPLPQLLTANLAERVIRKKAVVVNLGLFTERLPILCWPLAAWLATVSPWAALLLFLVTHAWLCLGGGVIATSWTDLVANCFPVALRGRMFGMMVVLGAGTGLAGAQLSRYLLAHYPFPFNFVYTFALAAVGIMISLLLLALTREPVDPRRKERQSHGEFFATLPQLLREDSNLRWFLAARLLMVAGGLGSGFLMVSAQERWQVPDATAATFTSAMLLGQVIGNLLCGFISDRRGHKLTLASGVTCSCLAYLLAAVAPDPRWYYAVYLLLGIGGGAFFVSGILMILELAIPERRPTYVGLVNTSLGLVGLLSPLLGAALAEVSYPLLFLAGATAYALGLAVFILKVREPRGATRDHAGA
ncbi:MAG: MFS transporter [Fimbriimonadaceae bacterium]|nr:MFS transporter [Fimbriimonadaceae bacterium]